VVNRAATRDFPSTKELQIFFLSDLQLAELGDQSDQVAFVSAAANCDEIASLKSIAGTRPSAVDQPLPG